MDPRFTSEEFNAFMQQTLELWHVPGAAVAVVKDGHVILSEGYGLRDIDHNLPANADTLFPIASCTKAFTAMCVGLLVDEGRLEWDKPLRDYLPTFKLQDHFASEHMTPRDLLCHRSGLPRHDLLWYASNFKRKEVFDRLKYLESNRDFRSTFQYQNMMFMVAGLLVEQVSGIPWEAFVKRRIFDKVGMPRTSTSTTVAQEDANHSQPYVYRHDQLKEMPFYVQDEHQAIGPAGAIMSCVNEMARWLVVHTNGGKIDGQQFISANNLAEMHKPHIFVDDAMGRQRFGFEFSSYGLGWSLKSFKGQVLVEHGGNINGFSSLVSFLPRQNLGVVVLSNGEGVNNPIPTTISYTLYDRLSGLEPTDWNSKFKELYEEFHKGEEQSKQQTVQEKRQVPPSHPIEDYLGEYEHPAYGIYTVRKDGDTLQVVANDMLVMALEHYHYDIFEATNEILDMRVKLSFSTDLKGNIAGFSTQLEPMVKDIYFTRLAERGLSDPAFLAQFTGTFEMLEMPLMVYLKEGKLFASLPGDEHELVPYQGTEFTFKGMPGVSIAFKLDENKRYSEARFTQPGMVFTATRKG
jgi:CubicO group peptidase (beta-lactamase class C family)